MVEKHERLPSRFTEIIIGNSEIQKNLRKKNSTKQNKKTPKPKTNQTTKPAIMWSLIREGHGVLKNKSMSWVWAGQVPGNRNLKNKTAAQSK